MKFVRFFIVAAMAVFSLEFSTASAAQVLAAAPATFSKASNTAPQQHRRTVHRSRRLRRIHRHH